jgi:hypothetical protein
MRAHRCGVFTADAYCTGPFSDAMTHVGQLARLRRLFGAACAFSTFILALPQSIAGAQAPDSIRRSASQPRPARALPLVLPSYPIEADAPWVPATVPSVLEVGRIQIVVTTARMISEFNHRGVGPSVVDDCQRFMLLDTPEYTGARYSNSWGAFDWAAGNAPLAIVHVGAPPPKPLWCQMGKLASAAHVVRGIWLTSPSPVDRAFDVRRVELRRNGVAVTPRVAARRTVRVFPARAAWPQSNAVSHVRLYLTPETLAPDAAGRFPSLILQIETADAKTETVVLPESAIAKAWLDLLPWHMHRLGRRGPPRSLVRPLPRPLNHELRRADSLYRSGDAAKAALRSERQLRSATILSAADARYATMQIALALLAHGDTTTAMLALAEALRLAPCLTLPLSTPAAYRRLVDNVRPVARCGPPAYQQVALRALLFPGGAQLAERRIEPAIVAMALTGAGFVLAGDRVRRGNAEYRRYQRATSTGEAVALYDRVTSHRRAARWAAVGAVTVWSLSGLEALARERRRGARVREVQDYGAVRLTVAPGAGRDGSLHTGLALTF